MEPPVVAALITAFVALGAAILGAVITLSMAHRQRETNLLVSALGQMGGKIQERSAAIAALRALRGPTDKPPKRLERGPWKSYGPAVGQQLYRQLIYILIEGEHRHAAHEVENIISMAEWLIEDDALEFRDLGQRYRLGIALWRLQGPEPEEPEVPNELKKIPGPPRSTSIAEARRQLPEWLVRLADHPTCQSKKQTHQHEK